VLDARPLRIGCHSERRSSSGNLCACKHALALQVSTPHTPSHHRDPIFKHFTLESVPFTSRFNKFPTHKSSDPQVPKPSYYRAKAEVRHEASQANLITPVRTGLMRTSLSRLSKTTDIRLTVAQHPLHIHPSALLSTSSPSPSSPSSSSSSLQET
jgi:hypothetical protein